jgi:hypothetical protein
VDDVGEAFELCGHVCTLTRQVNDNIVKRDNPGNVPVVHDRHSANVRLVYVVE